MWDPPRSSIEPVSPELAGRFFITEPLGKPSYARVLDEKAQPQNLKIAHSHIASDQEKFITVQSDSQVCVLFVTIPHGPHSLICSNVTRVSFLKAHHSSGKGRAV